MNEIRKCSSTETMADIAAPIAAASSVKDSWWKNTVSVREAYSGMKPRLEPDKFATNKKQKVKERNSRFF